MEKREKCIGRGGGDDKNTRVAEIPNEVGRLSVEGRKGDRKEKEGFNGVREGEDARI